MSWTKVQVNERAIRGLLEGRGEVAREVNRVLRQTANAAKQLAPADKGGLRASVNQDLSLSGGRLVGRVYADAPYARYVHEGTGVYGPRKRPIRPKRAKMLAFTPKGSSTVVFANEVHGSPPNKFLLKAAQQNFPWPVTEQ